MTQLYFIQSNLHLRPSFLLLMVVLLQFLGKVLSLFHPLLLWILFLLSHH
ncbi:hypothetical protein RchiOBHm_Chr2g0160321 [Rosa chinensis]|uniref:Uncharacterized protein n=1 Tax=Rosa chinensis TaxID=74649 RepID=A0A2P6S2I5_ROSCH|nr:hypothetical protein RchiOBHm_Chr2g0160321 [Rosa chinensis]